MRLQTINHLYSQFVGFKMLSNSPQSWEALLLAQSWEAPFVLAQPQKTDVTHPWEAPFVLAQPQQADVTQSGEAPFDLAQRQETDVTQSLEAAFVLAQPQFHDC